MENNNNTATNTVKTKGKLTQVGGLYSQVSKTNGAQYFRGVTYFTNAAGVKERKEIVIFPNGFKEKETDFDYCMYLDDKVKVKVAKVEEKQEVKTEDAPPF